MFGTFRLFLSLCVVAFHMGLTADHLYPGIAAVICFLMVSGYAMAGLIEKSFPEAKDIPGFYLDRAARLLPQYWFYLVVSAVMVFGFGQAYGSSQSGSFGAISALAHIALLPIGFYMISPEIGNAMPLPQAWTLGLEAVFYLLLPILLMRSKLLTAALIAAAAAFTLATNGIINPDFWSYRLMPAPLLWFLAGAALQRGNWRVYFSILLFTIASMAWLCAAGLMSLQFNTAILFGALVGLVSMPILAKIPRQHWDDIFGHASYGVYLSHYLFIPPLAEHMGELWAIAVASGGSVMCGWLSWRFIEMPITIWRRRFRRPR